MDNSTANEANSSGQEETSQAEAGSTAAAEDVSSSGAQPDGVRFEHGRERARGRRRYRRVLTRLITNRSIITTFAHASMGIALIAVGWVIRSLFDFKPKIIHTVPAASQVEQPLLTPAPNASVQQLGGIPSLALQPASLGAYACDAITCHPQLSLICICAGCVYIFCAFSGGLMVYHRMKEYVCCHLVWVSVSALCAITLSAACMMGLRAASELGKGLVTCTCTLIVASVLETIFCALDLFNVSNYFVPASRNRRRQVATEEDLEHHSTSDAPRNETREWLRQGSSRSESTAVRGGSGRGQSSSITIDITQERTREQSTRSSTRSRGTRDRNLLHPGYQSHNRHRTRRRPILRAQNHYVLVPAPLARSRAHSRARTIGERRNRNDMPMFVIPNHDRYVRALNQSMETLETGFNRGSVPSNVLPSSPAYTEENTTDTKDDEKLPKKDENNDQKQGEEAACSSSSSQPKNEMPDSAVHQGKDGKESNNQASSPLYQVDDGPELAQSTGDGRRTNDGRERPAYSVVKRSKGYSYGKHSVKENRPTSQRTDRFSVPNTTSLPFLQTMLADKLSYAASVVLDGSSVRSRDRDADLYRASFVDGARCPPPPPTPDGLDWKPSILYNTSSEGDFSTISNESTTTPTYDRRLLASVSSDSGIGEHAAAARGQLGTTPRYCNVPLYGSPRVSLELSSLGASSFIASLPVVSPKTPAYENVDVQLQDAKEKEGEGTAFLFS